MANAGVPKGNMSVGLGKGISNHGGMVNDIDDGKTNAIGIPYGQAPGIGNGDGASSMNDLPSIAKVYKPATSNLMSGMSQNRGSGGNR